ncbi:paxillin [Eurytemora carolleeae]|uniref:paxillin n=1 Tax=Eurytemora carolleeae TaxID=1294199 RepID=UPI000C762C01|nr:paxillin [Eurytemora carolleeae]|eukprot:XP_023340460.1 paxillin-like [Eurytemora affinis]
MTALSNNLNELDVLLQDLSAARYSGHIERRETVIESRTFSSHSNYQDGSDTILAPRPPERNKNKGGVGKFLDGPDPHTELHAVERTRTEKSTRVLTDSGDESKWEYMGFGIWENRDGSTSPSGLRNSAERTNGFNESGVQENKLNFQGKSFVEERDIYVDRSAGFNADRSPGFNNDRSPGFNSDRSPGFNVERSPGFNTDWSPGFNVERSFKTTERSSGYQVEQVGASNATQELDDLMTSLNNFKMADRNVDEPVISPNLDTMLGNLQEDMDKQGVKTTQKGVCGACKKPIVGQVITALGYTWHPEHFTCAHCNQELGTSNFFERDGKPFCEQDYHHLFSPRCGFCSGPILDKCISALDNTWHPEHFLCSGCGHQLGEEGFHEREDAAYCKTCYFDQFAPKCGGCNTPITENYISSLNQQWHPNCFVCKECNSPFNDGAFFEHDGFPYCETHYHALRGSLCAGCHKPISGRCITAMFRKFHPEHFVCSFCLKQLNKGTFKEQGDKPYCHECFDRLFG